MDGWKNLEELKKNEPYNGVPFLAVIRNIVRACCYKKAEYSDSYNFYYLDDEGDLQYVNPDEIAKWKSMQELTI